jgi:hypothetical protein
MLFSFIILLKIYEIVLKIMNIIQTPLDIFKFLIIDSLILPSELQEYIKSFVFYHEKQVLAIRNKKGLINSFKKGLNYDNYIGAYGNLHWTLSFRYEIMLSSVNCSFCGNFKSILSKKNISCSCVSNSAHENENNQESLMFIY